MPRLHKCTESKKYVKTVICHIWEEYMEMAEDIRNKEIYEQRKETSERIFGTVKEQQGFRYTQYIGKVRMNFSSFLGFWQKNHYIKKSGAGK